MIIKAKGSVIVPKVPHSLGQVIPFCKDVAKAIQQLSNQAWDVKAPRLMSAKSKFEFQVTLKKDGEATLATIELGYVRFIDPKATADPVLKDWIPETLDDDPQPTFEVTEGQTIYCLVNTDTNGVPTTVTIVVDERDKATVHYVPPPDDPTTVSATGEYYYPIADIEADADTGALYAKQIQHGGPILHVAELWEGENLGDGAYLSYKQIDPDTAKFQFRTIKQLDGDGIPILKPLEDPDDPPDQIEFRRLKERASSPQIKIKGEADADEIEISGNDFDVALEFPGLGAQSIKDGLTESGTSCNLGDNFDLRIWACVQDIGSPPPTDPVFTIYFREGLAFVTEPEWTGRGDAIEYKDIYQGFSCQPVSGP